MTEDTHAAPLRITLDIATSSSEIAVAQVEREYLIRIDASELMPATLAWDPALSADLAALRRADCDPEILQRLGQRLRQFLRGTDWPRYEATILDAHARGVPVHLTICASARAEELYTLPWDLLALDASGQHLAELPGVLVRYAWRRNIAVSSPDGAPSGRILMAWSAAAGEVPASAHRDALQRACGRRSPVFDRQRDVLAHVSWGRLEDALRSAEDSGKPVRVLHILCHGATRGHSFGLAWNDDYGDDAAIIDPARLRQLLAQYAQQLRVVVLSACDSSNESALGREIGSLARNLHRVGIQTVIGSAVPLSTRGSIAFTERFYQALVVDGASVADAFLRARRALARHVRTHDWLALRFYASPGDGEHARILPAPPPRASLLRALPRWSLSALVLAFAGLSLLGVLALMPEGMLEEIALDSTLPVRERMRTPTEDAGPPPDGLRPTRRRVPRPAPQPVPTRPPDERSSDQLDVQLLVSADMRLARVFVDGRGVRVLRRTATILTIRVPPGSHDVTLRTRERRCTQTASIAEPLQVIPIECP
jgi:hypothetical protein